MTGWFRWTLSRQLQGRDLFWLLTPRVLGSSAVFLMLSYQTCSAYRQYGQTHVQSAIIR